MCKCDPEEKLKFFSDFLHICMEVESIVSVRTHTLASLERLGTFLCPRREKEREGEREREMRERVG